MGGKRKLSVSGALVDAGYYTIKFFLPVPVTSKANFSVVVGLNVPSDVHPIPVEPEISGISNRNDSSAFIPVPPLKAIGCGSCRIPQRPVQPVFDKGEADGSLSKFCPSP